MIPALLTTLLWSLCVVAAGRSVAQLGENAANFWRLLLAVVLLGTVAHVWGGGLAGAGLMFFLLSGVVGFGLGDIGGFYALPRIGPRLAVLLSQCGAAPIAGFAEWAWLGTTVRPLQIAAVGLMLVGIVIALAPERGAVRPTPRFWSGVVFGLIAACGQGLGAVLSRRAYQAADLAGEMVADPAVSDSILLGATAGYQRLVGGMVVVALFFGASQFVRAWHTAPNPRHAADPTANKLGFIAVNALSGPVIGIICFQWALATTPSFIVQPIVAMTPLAVIPFAWWIDGDKPPRRFVIGALVAVAGVIGLAFA
jgi:drug/metabolite transporter (DMT)-like permease